MENALLKRVEAGIAAQPFARLLGLRAEDAEPGRVTVSCEKQEDLLQQTGVMHGGVIAALAEAASGYAALTLLPEGGSVLGVEYKVNFLRACAGTKLLAKAHVVKNGRSLIIIDVEVFDADTEKMVAKMLATTVPVRS